MTAITATGTATAADALLRLAMRLDAICVGISGIALLAAAGWFSDLTGLPKSVEYGVGIFSVVYGVVVFALAAIDRVRPAGVGTVIANAACTVIALIAVFAMSLTTAGTVAVIATGIYTAVMAELQYVGVRRIKA
ncbi:hypothetical protein MMAG44476_29556 [Mycolicibacterium mageritense DSM 44476 = CIP 104973]|uniref:Uncharacterized protein n=1 Tax=Mycolicibacterium mageritense TaxID=53462 RepID=A0AAI8TKK4_MYCME|nr:hypothetical protein [Mycolicibacterium mageritense]MBN3457277.1 hypothetical protein [Mycobacterium sp. DSM 3803]OKH76600.1 membrane protein [Mycobacterium sp. SWH-M3]MCC9182463.1 hypothetical protein [Mycolicibacterium mageritense]CDO25057.1 hypothetical protein BN978_05557 [Mycolicibacterium mageritense DSM 44476 = CIP 104973]BBX31310.1 hypothetical protein MMAGJ_05920 [Mycolicibacterium mageritense]